jgi:hypothetical protein
MVQKCKECGQFDAHVNRHLQKHLDEYAPKIPEKKTPWESFSSIPEGMNRALLNVFEKYNLGDESMPLEEWLFELCPTRTKS